MYGTSCYVIVSWRTHKGMHQLRPLTLNLKRNAIIIVYYTLKNIHIREKGQFECIKML